MGQLVFPQINKEMNRQTEIHPLVFWIVSVFEMCVYPASNLSSIQICLSVYVLCAY